MTAQEQANLDTLRAEVQAGFAEIRNLMEARRLEEVRVSENLATRIAFLEARHVEDQTRSQVADRFFAFGKWILGTIVAMAALVMAYFNR